MRIRFSAAIVHWRGPAPFHFVAVPDELCDEVREYAAYASYGWGVVPVSVTLGGTTWSTSLFPKDGGYLVPIKDAVRRAEGVEVGDSVELELRDAD